MTTGKRKWSIKTRILISILALIGVIFCCIIVAFNFLVTDNIEKNGIRQIQNAIQIGENVNTSQMGNGMNNKGTMGQMKSRADVLIINADYGLEFPRSENAFPNEIQRYTAIVEVIKTGEYSLGDGEIYRIATEFGDYYAATLPANTPGISQELFMVFFVNISGNIELAEQVNTMLAVLLGLAFLLAGATALLLSRKIAKPVEQLGDFAERIGTGDFTRCNLDFADREISRLADIMNKSAEQLDRYDKNQKIFFQNASHELRTPLMSIKGYGEAIKYKVMDSEKAADIILEESDKLTEMVEDLLYISKIDNITKDAIKISCDLREILSSCCIAQKARALNKGIEFVYEFDGMPVMLECDEKRVARAFDNIIDNGIRYAKSQLQIFCKVQEGAAVVSIKDDGDGIPEKDAPHIFERFYKGEMGRNGIGLAIVKSIVEEHDGEIRVSNEGNGTRFTLRFPVEKKKTQE